MTAEPGNPGGWAPPGAPDAPVACPCGLPVRQPWRTRDALWSPASFLGGLIWLALGVGSVIGGWTTFGLILLGVLAALTLGSLVLQAIRRHRGGCLLGRAGWFGLAVPGLPLRVTFWFSF
ncbi:hypothetical protein EV652_119105 [Kribbella steppae]|uniref:Uncharacterized protein n=1 Tax=Kribbella steppae TaxID=2512223 RepID=A0A4R2H0I7_9ACTN|nr:hypothetical protein [Kribbella steppae]TCO16916.1 hypothetical protein EV652_119105 [Kribbella steppae]